MPLCIAGHATTIELSAPRHRQISLPITAHLDSRQSPVSTNVAFDVTPLPPSRRTKRRLKEQVLPCRTLHLASHRVILSHTFELSDTMTEEARQYDFVSILK